jgi:D-alanine transaminase
MDDLACLNGELMPADKACIPIWDRGFLFGDAIYEVYRLYQGRVWLEDEHTARLRRSLQEMAFTGVDLDRLAGRMHETISESRIEEGTVYIHVTRGVAPRLHAFPGPETTATELIVVRPYDDAPTARLRESGVATISQPDLRWKRCDVKSTNLLANVFANEAARRAGAYEAILVAEDGLVTEATHSSVLWVRDGRLEGTPEGPGILPGTTRQQVLRLAAEEGITYTPSQVTPAELKAADEAMLVGTTIEVLPIVRIDEATVGDGRPGPVARRLQAAFRRSVERWLAPEPV